MAAEDTKSTDDTATTKADAKAQTAAEKEEARAEAQRVLAQRLQYGPIRPEEKPE